MDNLSFRPLSLSPVGDMPRMLFGWKAIVAYTGISKSTLKRWAGKIDFPLRRAVNNGMVYAFPHEVDDWWQKAREPKRADMIINIHGGKGMAEKGANSASGASFDCGPCNLPCGEKSGL